MATITVDRYEDLQTGDVIVGVEDGSFIVVRPDRVEEIDLGALTVSHV